jgi:hypothetical protein
MHTKIAVLLALLLVSIPPADAWEKSVNTGKPGPHLKIRPQALSFQMSWNGAVNSGRANMIFGRPDKRYPNYFICQMYGASGGVAKTFYPYNYDFTSFLSRKDYTPRLFLGNERDNKESKVTTNKYGSKFSSKEVTTVHKKPGSPKTKLSAFKHSGSTIYDLMSSVLYIRSLPLKTGDETVMVMHPFASPYLARVKVLGREVHNGRNSIKLDLQLQKINSTTGKLMAYKKMKKATMWISDDKERLPIEFRIDAFIGHVRATLDGRKFL